MKRKCLVSSSRDQVELVKGTNLINGRTVNDIPAFNMTNIEETIKLGGSLRETMKKLGIGRDRIHALKDENGNVTNNVDGIVR